MEYEMKISPNTIRRLRLERGWPQDQLAKASGISLRTIQRVEAEGIASINTAISLAATFNIDVKGLQKESVNQRPIFLFGLLLIGIIIITFAVLSESGRMPSPQSDLFATLNIFGFIIGLIASAPALAYAFRNRKYVETGLIIIGTPLITLFIAACIYWLVNGRFPSFLLFMFGAGGSALLIMAYKELRNNFVKV